MKKGKKLLVLSTLLGIAIGAGGIIEYHDATQKVHNKEIMAYKQDATNILDNVYTKDGKKLLPIIYTQSNKNITRNKIISDFKAKGLTIKNTVPENIGTGTQIITDKATYEVVIYGDINGDRMIDWKHPETALQVAAGLREQGIDFRLDMIGGGALAPEMQERARALGLEGQVAFLGYRSPEETRDYMEKAHIFLATSDRHNGFPDSDFI